MNNADKADVIALNADSWPYPRMEARLAAVEEELRVEKLKNSGNSRSEGQQEVVTRAPRRKRKYSEDSSAPTKRGKQAPGSVHLVPPQVVSRSGLRIEGGRDERVQQPAVLVRRSQQEDRQLSRSGDVEDRHRCSLRCPVSCQVMYWISCNFNNCRFPPGPHPA